MAGDLIDAYLARLRAGLPDSSATSRALAEVEDGLRSAAEDHVRHGTEPRHAARLAVTEFGDPEALAADFVPVLAAAEAHRDGLALLLTGPAVGILWLASAVLTRPAAPVPVAAGVAAVGLVLVATIPRLGYAVATTGRLSSRLQSTPARAVRAVSTASWTAVALDATLVLIALPGLVLLSPTALPAVLAAAAAVLSSVRLAAAARLAHRLGGFRAPPIHVGRRH